MSCASIVEVPTLGLHETLPSLFAVASLGLIIHEMHSFPPKVILA
jgi:hypothetical protein